MDREKDEYMSDFEVYMEEELNEKEENLYEEQAEELVEEIAEEQDEELAEEQTEEQAEELAEEQAEEQVEEEKKSETKKEDIETQLQKASEFRTWVRNTWSVSDQSKLDDLMDILAVKGVTSETEKLIEEVRQIVIKRYDEYATSFVEDWSRSQDILERENEEKNRLKERLANKDNYLIKGYDHAAKILAINLDYDISQMTSEIRNLANRKRELLVKKEKRLSELKERLELTNATLAQAREELAIVNNDDEKYKQLLSDYYALLNESRVRQMELANFDSTIEDKEIEQIDSRLDLYNKKLRLLEQRKEENDKLLNGEKKYDENAIRLDEIKLQQTRAGIEAMKRRLENTGNTDYVEIFDKLVSKYKKQEQEIEKKLDLDFKKPERRKITKVKQWFRNNDKALVISTGIAAFVTGLTITGVQVYQGITGLEAVSAQNAQIMTENQAIVDMKQNQVAWDGTTDKLVREATHQNSIGIAEKVFGNRAVFDVGNNNDWMIDGKLLGNIPPVALLPTAGIVQKMVASGLGGLALSMAGVGTVVYGVRMRKKSDAYKAIDSEISYLRDSLKSINNDDYAKWYAQIYFKLEECESKKLISRDESDILLRRLKNIVAKRKKLIKRGKIVVEKPDLKIDKEEKRDDVTLFEEEKVETSESDLVEDEQVADEDEYDEESVKSI